MRRAACFAAASHNRAHNARNFGADNAADRTQATAVIQEL